MKFVLVISFWLMSFQVFASEVNPTNQFEQEAKLITEAIKNNLMSNLQKELKKSGPVKAIRFCHENATDLTNQISSELKQKYNFGRTSHKVRSGLNKPQGWMQDYLTQFKGTLISRPPMDSPIIFEVEGKKTWLKPLYTQPVCLQCHGTNISKLLKDKINLLYPDDQAYGFKLNEFRGFIWVQAK
jgi:hypothetical protein